MCLESVPHLLMAQQRKVGHSPYRLAPERVKSLCALLIYTYCLQTMGPLIAAAHSLLFTASSVVYFYSSRLIVYNNFPPNKFEPLLIH